MEVKSKQSLYQLFLLWIVFLADVFIVELMEILQVSVLCKTNVTTTLRHFTHHLACFNELREPTVTTPVAQRRIAEQTINTQLQLYWAYA